MRFSRLSLSALLFVAAAASPTNNGEDNNGSGGNQGNQKRGKNIDTIDTLVDLGYTKYQGVQLAAGVTQYLGLRFAAAPLGNLRFRAPVDPPRNDTTQDASHVREVFFPFRIGISADLVMTAWAIVLFCRCGSQWRTIRRLPVYGRLRAFERDGKIKAPSLLLDSRWRLHWKLEPKLQWHQPHQFVRRQCRCCQLQLPSWAVWILGK